MRLLKPLCEIMALGIFTASFMGSALILSDKVEVRLPIVASMGDR